MATFGKILKSLRSEKGYSQQDLAADIGLSKSAINMYEQDARQPNFETLEIIADYFNVDIDFLLGRTNKTTKIINDGHYYHDEETRIKAQEKFESKEMRMLMDAAQDATPEDIETVYTMLLALKKKERGE